jgi:hypothetical protein
MNKRRNTHRLLPLLALSAALAMATSAHAQNRHYDASRANYPSNTSPSIQVTFGTTPHWSTIRGTHVREIREGQRPDYDMFSYGGNYYVYSNNQWYRSRRPRGQFVVIDERLVPREFVSIPRTHWHNYPSAWADNNGNNGRGNHGRGRRGYGNR